MGVGRIVYAWILALTLLTLTACNKTASPPVAPPTPAAIESARVARRLSFISEADEDFLDGNLRNARRVYSNGAMDKNELVSAISKRKMASVYEVLGQEKESLALLKEIESEKGNPIALDPLTSLKILYFADKQGDRSAAETAFSMAEQGQASVYSVQNDLLIATGSKRNTYYWMATEAATVRDWTLFDWAIEHANKAEGLTFVQWLHVAEMLEKVDGKRAASICNRIEAKLTDPDRIVSARITKAAQQPVAMIDEGKPDNAVDKAGSPKPSNILKPNIEKFKVAGYWITGAKFKPLTGPRKMGQAR